MEITISPERPDSPECTALIDELQTHLASFYPPASQHGFSIQRLVDEQVAFFVLQCDGAPAGCGGIKFYPEYGELKRIFVRPAYRGQGLSKRIMQRLETHAAEQGTHLVRLETGIYQQEAIALYERMGYQRIPPFGEYVFDPLSLYFEKTI
jgi:GNAT superfamily N-acetyltransferase